jgi:MFS family permease
MVLVAVAGVSSPAQSMAQMAVTPAGLRSTACGLSEVLYFAGNAIGPVAAGALSDALGGAGSAGSLRSVLLLGAAMQLVAAAVVWSARGYELTMEYPYQVLFARGSDAWGRGGACRSVATDMHTAVTMQGGAGVGDYGVVAAAEVAP